MIVADATTCLEVSGRGELLEPADGVHAIGSGSRFAIAAARALMSVPGLQPLDVAQRAMRIAAEKCVYTNSNFIWECIGEDGQLQSGSSSSQAGGSMQQPPQQQSSLQQ
jgi:ATP-dependent HslUV protease subunit HslV